MSLGVRKHFPHLYTGTINTIGSIQIVLTTQIIWYSGKKSFDWNDYCRQSWDNYVRMQKAGKSQSRRKCMP